MGSAGAAAPASRTKAECDGEHSGWELQCGFSEVEMKQMTDTQDTNAGRGDNEEHREAVLRTRSPVL